MIKGGRLAKGTIHYIVSVASDAAQGLKLCNVQFSLGSDSERLRITQSQWSRWKD